MFDAMKLQLAGGFSDAELTVIQDDAFELLSEVGIRIDHEGIVAFLETLPGVSHTANRVMLSRDVVEKWLPRIREDNQEYSYNRPGDAWRLVAPYMPSNYRDPVSGEVRLAGNDDLRLCARLGDALDMYGPEPLHVQDAPAKLRQLLSFKTTLENSRYMGGWAPAVRANEIQFMIEMGQAAGRKPPYACMELPISPLRLNAELLAMIFERRDRDDQFLGIVVGGGAVPMPGATAPLSFPACLAQALAEALAAYIIPQLIDPRISGYCSFGGFLFNMRTMDIRPYFPESLLYQYMVRQIIRHVFGATMGSQFKPDDWTNPGKVYQMGFAGMVDALSGARTVSVGAELGDIMNPLNMVLAADLVRHLQKTTEGLPLDYAPGSTRQLVGEGLGSGMYTDLESALNYRRLYVEPRLLFRYDTLEDLMQAAREEMTRLLAENHFALDPDVQRDVDSVFDAARRSLSD